MHCTAREKSNLTVDKSAIFKTVALTIAAIATAVSAQPDANLFVAFGAEIDANDVHNSALRDKVFFAIIPSILDDSAVVIFPINVVFNIPTKSDSFNINTFRNFRNYQSNCSSSTSPSIINYARR